jgi:hypothetical protein
MCMLRLGKVLIIGLIAMSLSGCFVMRSLTQSLDSSGWREQTVYPPPEPLPDLYVAPNLLDYN